MTRFRLTHDDQQNDRAVDSAALGRFGSGRAWLVVNKDRKAVNVSYERSGPWIGPDILDKTLQFVPNWNAITTPDTTPRPKATPNILSQKSKSTR
jgi:hypothetical protein